MRVEDEDVDRVAVAAGFECRRAGIAGGGADDRHMLGAPGQRRIEQQPNKLQCQILEGKGRPVEQLQQPQALVKLHQRGHRGMAEFAIGLHREPPATRPSQTCRRRTES